MESKRFSFQLAHSHHINITLEEATTQVLSEQLLNLVSGGQWVNTMIGLITTSSGHNGNQIR